MALASGVSIIISTYNGRHLLDKTLHSIAKQKLRVPCELIVVDNGSTDDTKDYVDEWWVRNGVAEIEFQSKTQEKPGKYFAQDLGIKSAKYQYVITCDDDNWLCDTYVQRAYDIMESDENIGVLGGRGEAVFEGGEKPDWFDKYARFFAAVEQGQKSGDITYEKGCVYGAGMVLQKSLYDLLIKTKFSPVFASRESNKLISGSEDTEICYAFRILGYKIAYHENLIFFHFIERKKQCKKYLWNLMKSQAASTGFSLAYRDIFKGQIQNQPQYFIDRLITFLSYSTLKRIFYLITNYKGYGFLGKHYLASFYYAIAGYKEYDKGTKKLKKWVKSLDNYNPI